MVALKMDKFLLLLLGVFLIMVFQGVAPDTLCMVCNNFKNGRCFSHKSTCIVEQGPGCRTRNFYIFSEKHGWYHNYTELDCEDMCSPSKLYYGDMKIATFCCKGRDFCNKYQGNPMKLKS